MQHEQPGDAGGAITLGHGVGAERPSDEHSRILVERSPHCVAVIDRQGRLAYANPSAIGLLGGRNPMGVVGRPAAMFVPDDELAAAREVFQSVLRGQTVMERRCHALRRDGVRVEVEITATRTRYKHQTAVLLEVRDITAQVQAEAALVESERRWRAVFDQSPVGMALVDERGRAVAVNASLCDLVGRSERQLLDHSAAGLVEPDEPSMMPAVGASPSGDSRGVARFEKRYVRPDGEVRWAWVTVNHTPGPAGETWTLAHVQDVTERKASEQAAAASRSNLRAVGEVIRQIQSGGDARQIIVEAGRQLAEASYVSLIEPYSGEDGLRVSAATDLRSLDAAFGLDGLSSAVGVYRGGQSLFLAEAADDPSVSPAFLTGMSARSLYLVPVRCGDAVTGVLVVAWDQHVPDLDDRRAEAVTLLVYYAGVALRQAELVAELEALAMRDPLTLLPNRRGWDEELRSALATAQRSSRPLTVAVAAVDAFDSFSETFGGSAGDEMLRQVAHAAHRAVRADDTVARWGAEQFAFALRDCPAEEAAAVLGRVRQAMPERLTCSIGFAVWDGQEDGISLAARAEEALRTARRDGSNRIAAAG